jgi:hypothetical protein
METEAEKIAKTLHIFLEKDHNLLELHSYRYPLLNPQKWDTFEKTRIKKYGNSWKKKKIGCLASCVYNVSINVIGLGKKFRLAGNI